MSLSRLHNFHITRDPHGVVTAALDVPGRAYNVFNEEVLAELQTLIDDWEHDDTARLLLFRSAKESGFLAGGDLREVYAIRNPHTADQLVTIGQKLFDRLERLPIPTVAVLHGPCLGGGLEFALACRYRLARDDDRTRLGLPEVALGLLPAWGGTQRLPERVGLSAALTMLLESQKVSAREAAELGLVDGLWPPEQFADGVLQFVADRLAGKPCPRRGPGFAAWWRDRTKLGQGLLLQAARRQIAARPDDRLARSAVVEAVAAGLAQGRQAGLTQERLRFPELLFSGVCRQRLEGFLHRTPARPAAAEPWIAGLTIGAALRQTAQRFGAREAVVFRQAGVRWTWAEFDQAVDRAARGLLGLGFRHGDHFGVWSTNWPQWVVLQFATARIGVVLVTINPAYRPAELEHALAQSEVRGLALIERYKTSRYFDMLAAICPELSASGSVRVESAKFPHLERVIALSGAARPGMLTWPELEAAAADVPPARLDDIQRQLDPGEPINLQYTSGTTGPPKGALLSHRNLLWNAFYAAAGQRLDWRDRICIPVPLYHCFGCVLGTMCSAVTGAAMIFPRESFDAAATLEAIEAERATAIYGVPTMFIVELEHAGFPGRDLSSLRTGIMAGSPCPIELMKRVVQDMGAREITIAYGQTEASPLVTMTRTDDPLEQRVGTVGRPLPGIEVKVVDLLSGGEVPDGCSGELCARGHNVMLGYYRMPDATARAIDAQGWLHTGDLALRQPDGYFRITGRIKEMIVRGGENIAPREIEEVLYQHPKVEQVAIVGVPDRKFGEEILAWIKLRAGEHATQSEICDFCRARLARFKTPRYVQFVESFPMTVTGKLQKYKIRQQAIAELGLEEAAAVETA